VNDEPTDEPCPEPPAGNAVGQNVKFIELVTPEQVAYGWGYKSDEAEQEDEGDDE
jgi:hypothetical protein